MGLFHADVCKVPGKPRQLVTLDGDGSAAEADLL